LGKRGWNSDDLNGGTDRTYLAVARGNTLELDSEFLGRADVE